MGSLKFVATGTLFIMIQKVIDLISLKMRIPFPLSTKSLKNTLIRSFTLTASNLKTFRTFITLNYHKSAKTLDHTKFKTFKIKTFKTF